MYHSISLGALLNPIEHSKPKVFGFERKSAAFFLDEDETHSYIYFPKNYLQFTYFTRHEPSPHIFYFHSKTQS